MFYGVATLKWALSGYDEEGRVLPVGGEGGGGLQE